MVGQTNVNTSVWFNHHVRMYVLNGAAKEISLIHG